MVPTVRLQKDLDISLVTLGSSTNKKEVLLYFVLLDQ